jgi:tetratricopeptide (TPR) repeat protein
MLRGIVELHRGDAEASVGKVLDASFERLYPAWLRVLLWRLSVLRGKFGLEMAQAMVDEPVELVDLRRLRRWSFLQEEPLDGQWQFDFSPLIARYLQLDGQEQEQLEIAHERAIDQYSANFQEWDGTIESCREELESFYHACELGQYQRADGMLDRCFEMLDRVGQWRSLLPLYEQLTAKWQTVDDSELHSLGWAWMRLGNLQQQLREIESSVHSHYKAKAIFDQMGFPEGQSAAFDSLGVAYSSLGQYQQAIIYGKRSLEIARETGDREGEASSLCNLGSTYASLGQYQHKIGNAHLEEYRQAITFYETALPLARAAKNSDYEANCICGLGDAYNFLGEYQLALELHQQDNKIAHEIGNPENEARSRFNMALSHYNLGDYIQALSDLQEAKAIYEDLELDDMIERCKDATRICNQAIISTRCNLP